MSRYWTLGLEIECWGKGLVEYFQPLMFKCRLNRHLEDRGGVGRGCSLQGG
jgi:hypothetical protein